MKSGKRNGSVEINQAPEVEVGGNIHELTCASDAVRQAEIIGDEIAVNSLGPFLRRVTEASRREIKYLIDELQMLDKQLEADGDRIRRDVEEYAELGQHVMQLTTIIADSLKRLPGAPSI